MNTKNLFYLISFLIIILLSFSPNITLAALFEIQNPKNFLPPATTTNISISTDPNNIIFIAQQTLKKLAWKYKQGKNNYPKNLASLQKTIKTLNFIIKEFKKDRKNNFKNVLNTNFIYKNFDIIKWNSPANVKQKNKIKITKYAIFKVKGNYHKTKQYKYALYEICNPQFFQKHIAKYSMTDILQGVLEKNGLEKMVKPLAWLDKKSFRLAQLNGTIIVTYPDKKTKLLHIQHHNKHKPKFKYNTLKNGLYWYFKEVTEPQNFPFLRGKNIIFAGNLSHVGLGKLILLKYKHPYTKQLELRLGILFDTGSLFTNNLNHLDYFVGTFSSYPQFLSYIKNIPNYSDTYFLIKK